VKQTSITENC